MNTNLKIVLGILVGVVAGILIGYTFFEKDKSTIDSTTFNAPTPSTKNDNNVVDEPTKQTTKVIQVSGKFSEYADDMAPGTVRFTASKPLPGSPDPSFIFTNPDLARQLFRMEEAGRLGFPACDTIQGEAQITISNFIPQDNTQSEGANSAVLVSVDKITMPAGCGRGPSGI